MRMPLPDSIAESGIFAVVRSPALPVLDVARALFKGGIRSVEITLDTPGAFDAIRTVLHRCDGETMVGAGTVVTLHECEQAIEAGAGFIVTPVAVRDVVEYCVRVGVPVFPGALTPTEIENVWSAGATGVKVFPVGPLGPAYLSACRVPLREVPMFAVGGVAADNAASFIRAGAAGVGVGNWLTGPNSLQTIEDRARNLVRVMAGARSD